MIKNDTVYMSNGKMIRETYKYIGGEEGFAMEFVKSIDDIKKNMRTLDEYLDKKCDPEYSYALGLIKKGLCFISVEKEGEYRFYPSRFMGYAENTISKHQNNTAKDGRKTNPVISQILNEKPSEQIELECAYVEYCKRLGIVVKDKSTFGKSRKYWRMQ